MILVNSCRLCDILRSIPMHTVQQAYRIGILPNIKKQSQGSKCLQMCIYSYTCSCLVTGYFHVIDNMKKNVEKLWIIINIQRSIVNTLYSMFIILWNISNLMSSNWAHGHDWYFIKDDIALH